MGFVLAGLVKLPCERAVRPKMIARERRSCAVIHAESRQNIAADRFALQQNARRLRCHSIMYEANALSQGNLTKLTPINCERASTARAVPRAYGLAEDTHRHAIRSCGVNAVRLLHVRSPTINTAHAAHRAVQAQVRALRYGEFLRVRGAL